MLSDTVAAVVSCPAVRHVAVVWETIADCDPSLFAPSVRHLPAPGFGLNRSVLVAERYALARFPGTAVVVVPGDLPAVDGHEFAVALARAEQHERAFLPDADGRGTSLLFATTAGGLRPAYGPASAERHASDGAQPIDPRGLATLRRDVDDLAGLHDALASGCGPRTAYLSRALGLTRGLSVLA